MNDALSKSINEIGMPIAVVSARLSWLVMIGGIDYFRMYREPTVSEKQSCYAFSLSKRDHETGVSVGITIVLYPVELAATADPMTVTLHRVARLLKKMSDHFKGQHITETMIQEFVKPLE